MSSKGVATYNAPKGRPPSKKDLPTPFVREFRRLLAVALGETDQDSGKRLGHCIGVYAFYDYDGEPIYVGQTTLNFSDRVGRHLTGQRSDTLAYRILDPFEVAEIELWPYECARKLPTKKSKPADGITRERAVDALEYSVYLNAIDSSVYHAILNEKIPPVSARIALPRSYRFNLIAPHLREEREHPDVRIARRADTLARVAAVAHERGEVSPGLRRVIVIQAIRLADLAAKRLAYAEGRRAPSPGAIDVIQLVGNVSAEYLDYDGEEEL